MHGQGWFQIIVFCAVLHRHRAAPRRLHGARVHAASASFLDPVVGPLERLTYRVLRVDPQRAGLEVLRRHRCSSSRGSFWLLLYLILRTQTLHPCNPEASTPARGT